MDRRAFLTTSAAAITALAGCNQPLDTQPKDDITPTDNAQGNSFAIIDQRFLYGDPDNHPDMPEARFYNNGTVTIQGKINVPNGCHKPTLNDTMSNTEPLTLGLTIASTDSSDGKVACTQAIKTYGYEVIVETTGDPITSVHLTIHGTETTEYTVENS